MMTLTAPPPPPATAARPVAFYDTECFPNYWLLKFRPRGGQAYGFRLHAGQAFDLQTAARIRLLFDAYCSVSFNGNYYDVPMITAALRATIRNAMIKFAYKPLADLPNQKGFRFVGVRHDGTLAECYIQQHPKTLCYFVTGDATYRELKGWVPYAS